jgi:hypothetical protein
MQNLGIRPSRYGLEEHGVRNASFVYWNLGTAQLIEKAIQRREGLLASGGGLVVRTGDQTGRSPRDKFVVRDAGTEHTVNWGSVNQPFLPEQFDRLWPRPLAYLRPATSAGGPFSPAPTCNIRFDSRDHRTRLHNLARQLCAPTPVRLIAMCEFTAIDAPGFTPAPRTAPTRTCSDRQFCHSWSSSAARNMWAMKGHFRVPITTRPRRMSPHALLGNVGADGAWRSSSASPAPAPRQVSAGRAAPPDPATMSMVGDRAASSTSGGCYAKCIRSAARPTADLGTPSASARCWKTSRWIANCACWFRRHHFYGEYPRHTRSPSSMAPWCRLAHPETSSLTCDASGVLPATLARPAMFHY